MDTVSWAEIGRQKVYRVAVYIYFQFMWPISDHENVTAPRPRNRVHFQFEKYGFSEFCVSGFGNPLLLNSCANQPLPPDRARPRLRTGWARIRSGCCSRAQRR